MNVDKGGERIRKSNGPVECDSEKGEDKAEDRQRPHSYDDRTSDTRVIEPSLESMLSALLEGIDHGALFWIWIWDWVGRGEGWGRMGHKSSFYRGIMRANGSL